MGKKKAGRKEAVAEPQEDAAQTDSETNGYTKQEQRHYREIQDTNRRVLAAKAAYLASKENTSELKKEYDGLTAGLEQLISAGPDLQMRLDGMDESEMPDDTWRDTLLDDAIQLTSKQCEILEEAGVYNMGQLEDLRAGGLLTSLKGIGEKAAQSIEDQMLDWLAGMRTLESQRLEQQEADA